MIFFNRTGFHKSTWTSLKDINHKIWSTERTFRDFSLYFCTEALWRPKWLFPKFSILHKVSYPPCIYKLCMIMYIGIASDYCMKSILIKETLCENCFYFTLKWFLLNSFGKICFLGIDAKKIQIWTILRVRFMWYLGGHALSYIISHLFSCKNSKNKIKLSITYFQYFHIRLVFLITLYFNVWCNVLRCLLRWRSVLSSWKMLTLHNVSYVALHAVDATLYGISNAAHLKR